MTRLHLQYVTHIGASGSTSTCDYALTLHTAKFGPFAPVIHIVILAI